MNRLLILTLALILGSAAARAGAAPDSAPGLSSGASHRLVQDVSTSPEVRKFLYHDAVASLRGGTRWTGLFAGLTDDSVLIWQPGAIHGIGLNQLRQLTLHSEGSSATSALYGLIAGAYIADVLGQSAGDEGHGPWGGRDYTYFRPGSDAPWLLAIGGAIIGGMAGYVAGSISSDAQAVFDFSGPEAERQQEIDRLYGGGAAWHMSKFHLRVSSGSVTFGRAQTTFPWGGPALEEEKRWSVFRRGTATYSITPWLEAGVGVADFSEPSMLLYATSENSTLSGEQSSGSVLYFVTARVTPLGSLLPRWLSWDAGVGFGPAAVDYNVNEHWFDYSTYQAFTLGLDRIHATRLGLTLFTGVTLFPVESISIGFTADYTGAPGVSIPPRPELGIKERTLGNVCIGVEIGAHF